MHCAQNEEANWCNGPLEVHLRATVAVVLCTLAAGGKWAQLEHGEQGYSELGITGASLAPVGASTWSRHGMSLVGESQGLKLSSKE